MVKIVITSILLLFSGITSNIKTALSAGNADQLSNYFAEKIDLTILDSEQVYSKSQATQILKKFFNENKVTSYSDAHNGKSKDGSAYVIGSLVTAKKTYRIYYLLKTDNQTQKIHQLRIEDENE